MLKLENLTIRFGGLTAVDNVTTHVEKGQIFGLVGPNGAGKTTTFNMISGYYAPTSGKVIFDSQEIQGKPQYEINHLGIARTYQNINLFNKMTVLENCMIGCHPRMKANIFDAIFNTPRKRREDAEAEEKCREILKFMDLGHREDYLAKNLSYGEQRRLEIARALVSDPKLLLLDEPAAGMNSTEKDELSGMIKSIRDMGITVLLVSHSMEDIAKYANRVLVMHRAKIAMYDTVENVFARAQELLELGLSVPQVTQIFLKLRQMGLDIPADVYTIPYAVKTIQKALAAKQGGGANA